MTHPSIAEEPAPGGWLAAVQPLPEPETGRLRLVFRARGNRTYLASQSARSPLKVVRPFLLPNGTAVVQVLQNGPGVLAGDRYEIEIAAERGARAVVISPSATKIHRMPAGGSARQRIRMCVEDDACLEYFPGLNIPFPEAEFAQQAVVELAPSARFAMLDAWAMGRIERDEYLQFRRLASRTQVVRNGKSLFRDALDLEPAAARIDGWGLLEQHRYVVSGYWHGPPIEPPSVFAAGNLDSLAVFGSVDPSGHYFRGLFRDSLQFQSAVGEVLQAVWKAWSLPPISLLPFRC